MMLRLYPGSSVNALLAYLPAGVGFAMASLLAAGCSVCQNWRGNHPQTCGNTITVESPGEIPDVVPPGTELRFLDTYCVKTDWMACPTYKTVDSVVLASSLLPNEHLEYIWSVFPCVYEVHFEHMPALNDAGISSLHLCSNLTLLELSGDVYVTNVGIQRLASLERLATVCLTNVSYMDVPTLDAILALPRIQRIQLDSCLWMRKDVIEQLAKTQRIEELAITNTPHITVADVMPLKQMKQLRVLDLRGCLSIGPYGIAIVRSCLAGVKVVY